MSWPRCAESDTILGFKLEARYSFSCPGYTNEYDIMTIELVSTDGGSTNWQNKLKTVCALGLSERNSSNVASVLEPTYAPLSN